MLTHTWRCIYTGPHKHLIFHMYFIMTTELQINSTIKYYYSALLLQLKPWVASPLVQSLLLTSVLIASVGCALGYWWRRNKWSNHPIAASLSIYNQPWRFARLIFLYARSFALFAERWLLISTWSTEDLKNS